MADKKFHGNIYGGNIRGQIEIGRVIKNRCYLCGGDHSKDIPRSVWLDCPHCGETGTYNVMPHCPGGISHGETHVCPNCGKNTFLVVYSDGYVFISKR